MFCRRIILSIFSVLTVFLSNACFGQVYKCSINGKFVYQQVPCENSSIKDNQVKIQTTPHIEKSTSSNNQNAGDANTKSKSEITKDKDKVSEPPKKIDAQPSEPEMPDTNIYVEQCFNWYRKLLRDPRGAYTSKVSNNNGSGTLLMTIHATNGFGGYVVKEAACEFRDGHINDPWTKDYAKEFGWYPYAN